MRCPSCNHDSPADASFCEECGAKLELICPACKASVSLGARFCKKCGTAIGPRKVATPTTLPSTNSQIIVAAGSVASEPIEGERKTVTALFADIRGSTELMEDLDPEEARAIIDPALKRMIDAAHRYDGYVVQSTGDGIFALFGAPVADEDHPQRALHAALRMQEELKRYSAKVVADGGVPIEARIGVNTGEVVVRSIMTGDGHTEYTPIGHTANLASRMQAIAPTGSIAITERTRRLVEGYFQLKGRGPTRVKGLSEAVNVYEVTGLGPLRTRLQRSVGRGLTKFVGREREMEALKHAAERARAGHGQIVAAMAEPGVGKSRLLFEFKATSQSGWMVLETFSVSHGKASAYLPVIDLLHGYFEIAKEDDSRRRRQKILGKLLELDRALEDTVPYLYALLGIVEGDDPLAQMDGKMKKRRTLEAIKRIALRESLNQPLMVIFEDLHWIDDATQEFLNLLADSIGTVKILLLVNYRPEYSHKWNSKTYYTQLRLDPLGRESADEMLSALLGAGVEVAQLKRLIIEKTEGNPFFMEETVQVLFDEGALIRDGSSVKLTRSLNTLKIPPTVQGILAARIDRLPSNAKDLLQTLAVIGSEFPLSLIHAVVPKSDEGLNRLLDDLQLGEFIYEQPTVGDPEYIFKHALTQEVAYNSILSDRRKLLHERTGAAIETQFAASIDDHLSELAHHYSCSANVPKAIEYLERAGGGAVERSAYIEAVSHFRAALELLRAMPHSQRRAERELALLLALGPAVQATKGWGAPEAEAVYVRARELCRELGETPQLFTTLFGLAANYAVVGKYKPAREILDECLSIAQKRGDSNLLLQAYHLLGWVQTYTGMLASARQSQDELIKSYDSKKHHSLARLYGGDDPAVCCLAVRSMTLWLLGYPEQAVQTKEASLRLAQQLSHPFSIAVAISNTLFLDTFLREWTNAIDQAKAIVALYEDHGFSQYVPDGVLVQSLFAPDRATTEGVKRIRRDLANKELKTGLSIFLGLFAEACIEGSDAHEAGAALAEALAIVERSGEHVWEAELFRLRGELKSANPVEAEADFRSALEVARSQDARSLELRATMSLARLLRDTNRGDEARTMLAAIYSWFSEGFDTADLKDAKTLLEEL